MDKLLFIFVGGGTGAIARYTMMAAIGRMIPTTLFPWPTLAVNMLGAVLIGILVEILALRTPLGDVGRSLLITGFLGGFTTFSTFSLETALMLERGDYAAMAAYACASVLGTVVAVFIGSGIVKAIG